MSEAGLGGMTDEECKAHLALWAALKSPLMIDADVRTLSAEALTTLNISAIVVLNKDPLGIPETCLTRNCNVGKEKWW